jgi:hypothetical protein
MKEKNKKMKENTEMLGYARRMQKHCDLLIGQCNNWLPPAYKNIVLNRDYLKNNKNNKK